MAVKNLPPYILAIDQGTSSTRAMLITLDGTIIHKTQQAVDIQCPQNGWVEQNPEAIWQSVVDSIKQLLAKTKIDASKLLGIGISNQRETTIVWDKQTGKAIYPAIVWQDRRTHDECKRLIADNLEPMVREKTGLLLDPYFSATKIAWILKHIPDAKNKASSGQLAFGTIDSFLLWRLTNGKVHATDITNASRTLLCNIQNSTWDKELLKLFDIPIEILPKIHINQHHFGDTHPSLFGYAIPIVGMMGDQQAAAFGQACFQKGDVKSTYGTGCFMLAHTGNTAILSKHRLLTTVNYQLNDTRAYGLEGSIFVAGATVQWLRDAMHMIAQASDSASLAKTVPDNGGVYLVPAFTGLGAPYWDPLARGAILGLTRDSTQAHIVRAGLEAVAYQSKDLFNAMQDDGCEIKRLRVDGGMMNNDWLVQFLTDMLNLPVIRPKQVETSVLGVAFLAGITLGHYHLSDGLPNAWQEADTFTPNLCNETRERWYQGWQQAIARIAT